MPFCGTKHFMVALAIIYTLQNKTTGYYYMHDLSVNLKKCPTGCIAGGTVVNHVMYADGILYY